MATRCCGSPPCHRGINRPAVASLGLLPIIAIAIVAKSGGLYRINRRRNEVNPAFTTPISIPGFVLMLRAVLDINLLDWKQAA
jgi:hypothetical protein